MNAIGEYWKALGRRIEAGLRSGVPLDTGFASLATEVVRKVPAPPMTATSIADWMIEEGTLPTQVNFHSGFGEPPLVVYASEQFYAEVLFWFPGRTAIHGHGFSGAFMVLDGMSIQTEFEFHEREAPEAGVRLGNLVPRTIEFIEPGRVCTIERGTGFIHAVAHLGSPSLTLVVRTYGRQQAPQFRYHRCGLAVLTEADQSVPRRQAEVLAAIHDGAPADFPQRLITLLERLNDCRFYTVLESLLSLLRQHFVERVMPIVEARFAGSRPHAVAALRERIRGNGIWKTARGLTNRKAQVHCALADLFPDVAERQAVLCRSYGVAHMGELPAPWRDLVGEAGGPANSA